MILKKLVALECEELEELLEYSNHPSLTNEAIRHKYIENIISTVITNITRELYYEPEPITMADVLECFVDAGMLAVNVDVHKVLYVVRKIRTSILPTVIFECAIPNTTVYVDMIANRFLNIYIYDITPIGAR